MEVYRGNVSSITVRSGGTSRSAVRENCQKVILEHNHPSGDPAPSDDDARMTKQLVEAGKLLDIEVLDHIVIGRNAFGGLKAQRLGFA